jgi:pimeloyl-ACP methyl ester carboxylesterase/DNA-binding winged helix-turn-helix (wHTH) protein
VQIDFRREAVNEHAQAEKWINVGAKGAPRMAERSERLNLVYVFDNYTLDLDKRELRAWQRVIEMQPQVFDVLQFLVINRDRVVGRDELLAAVWRGRIVSESTASRINAARSAIGDNGDDQKLIRTFLRKGFRFVCQAREVEDAGGARAAGSGSADDRTDTTLALAKQTVTFCRTRNGVNLATATIGSGPVVLRAGHWGTHIEYDLQSPITGPLLRRLGANFNLIRYDDRGMGLSDWNADEISFATFLDDLETVVDSLGLKRFALLGMHSGAAVSIAYAVRYPQRVSKLVLYGGYAQGHQKRDLSRDADWAKAMAVMLSSSQEHPVFIRAFSSLWLPNGTPEQVQWFMDLARVSHSSESQAKFAMAVGNIDVADLLPMVSTPTIVFHCIHDRLIPFSQGRLLACSISNAALVALDSENHVLLSSEPAWTEMIEEMEAFLAADSTP